MCIYDRNAFDCGHQEWGPMKAQCTRYWQKCCIRTGHESFTVPLPGLCHSCQTHRPDEHDVAPGDSLHLTIRFKPSLAKERPALDTANGRPIHPGRFPTPENVKSYITNCIKRYQQAHNLPEDSVKVSDAPSAPVAKGPRVIGDPPYHNHICGLSNPNCKKLQDYQMQIMLLEHQNKRRLMMARGESEAPNAAIKQPITTPTYEDIKCRHYELQDYQRQLMGQGIHTATEQQQSCASAQGQSEAQPKSEPQDPLNEQSMKNLSLDEYQKQLMNLRCGNHKKSIHFPPVATECPPNGANEPRFSNLGTVQKRQAQPMRIPEINRIVPFAAPTMQAEASTDAFTKPADADDVKNGAAIQHRRTAVQDYEMQLMLLEQQNKKRLMMARAELDKMVTADDTKTDGNEQKLAMDSAPEAQFCGQDKKIGNHALQDYQTQLMQLEQQRKKLLMAERHGQQNSSVSSPSYDQESEQIMEMGSALGAQQKDHEKGDHPSPIAAASPLVVRQDSNGVQWMAFEHVQNDVKLEYTIRCDVNTVNSNDFSPGFRTENCLYPRACVHIKEYKGERLLYEIQSNKLGWALAHLNPLLRNRRSLIERAVDYYQRTIEKAIRPYCEDEEDIAMWSTDEFDEWSICGDDIETVEKDEV